MRFFDGISIVQLCLLMSLRNPICLPLDFACSIASLICYLAARSIRFLECPLSFLGVDEPETS
jgi:hypothetical protein